MNYFCGNHYAMKPGFFESASGIIKMIIFGVIILISSLIFSWMGIKLSGMIFGVSGMQVVQGVNLTVDAINALKLIQVLQTIGIFIFPALLSAFLFSKKPWNYLGFKKVNINIVLLTILVVVVSLPAVNLLASVNQLIPLSDWMLEMERNAEGLTKTFLVTKNFGTYLFNIVMVAVLPAFGEEFIFRGILQRRIVEQTRSRWTGIVIAAALFSAIHLQFQGFIPRFALGVAFGYLLEVTGSIWVPIAAHFFNNAMAATGYMLMGLGAVDDRIENFGGLSDIWLFGIVSLIVSILLIVSIEREIGRSRKSEQSGNGAFD